MTSSCGDKLEGEGVELVARAVCRERCAAFGEPACWEVNSGALTRKCAGDDDLDCFEIGTVAFSTLSQGSSNVIR